MRILFCLVLFILLLSPSLYGDGCYIPERAFKKIPEIPAQRAILAWKDGVETLIISSALDSESEKLGWIIPLPNVPTMMEKATPGSMKTLSMCLQPKITHDLTLETKVISSAILISIFLLVLFKFYRSYFYQVVILVFFVMLLISLMLPALGETGETTIIDSESLIEKSVNVGAYDIKILNVSNPNELNTWLTENSFATLPQAADSIVSDYCSKGWKFAAIKLNRFKNGNNTPHPIKMVFASSEPIYPMKLTSLASNHLNFEIFVLADEAASCDLLAEQYCDRFKTVSSTDFDSNHVFKAESTRATIGHGVVCSLMWNKCIVTKLAGTINSNDMAKDLQINFKSFLPFQQHFYTFKGAWSSSLILFLALAGSWLFFSLMICCTGIRHKHGIRWYYARIIFPGLVIALLITVVRFSCIPKLAGSEVRIYRYNPFNNAVSMSNTIEDLLWKHPNLSPSPLNKIENYLLKALNDSSTYDMSSNSELLKEKIILEDSPGNFMIEKDSNEIIIHTFSRYGESYLKKLSLKNVASFKNLHTEHESSHTNY